MNLIKNHTLLFAITLIASAVFSQQKGVTPVIQRNSDAQGKTYAVVVGISDYQDSGIPDLRFADKDAHAFADFLRSPAGGALDENHLKVLINQQATAAQFAIALDWLWEVAKENDRVFIYFSGHGDVEKRSLSQPGYLLCWDAPAKVYMAGGALNVRDLKEVVSTLSIQNKAKVILITDACRSGKLSGSGVDGAQATTSNLSQQFANEVKILSCQPNEYSIEGEQWGGGRGAFSYHLINSIYGLADANKDFAVSLKEIGRYLDDRVTTEVAPVNQNPQIIGNPTEILARVDANMLAATQAGNQSQLASLSPIETRGIEDEILSKVDTTIKTLYHLFKSAIKDKILLEPKNACAEAYYKQLIAEPKLLPLHSTLRRNYAAALQDDAQQELNTMLKSGLTKDVLADKKYINSYNNYPEYLQRASELLGESHYMYSILQARKYFFMGMMTSSNYEKQLHYFKALELQPEMPHAFLKLISTYPASQIDSAEYYTSKAMEAVSNWVLPYCELAIVSLAKEKNPSKAEELFNKAGEIDSTSVLVWYYKGKFYTNLKKYDKALPWLEKALKGYKGEFCFPCMHLDLGTAYYRTHQIDKAFFHVRKALEFDSTNFKYLATLANLYQSIGNSEEALLNYKKALEINPNEALIYYNIGIVYKEHKEYKMALEYVLKAAQMDSMDYRFIGVVGEIYLDMNLPEVALPYFEKSLALNSKSDISHWDIGLAYLALGKWEEAKQAFEKALSLNPNNAKVHFALSRYYCLKQNIDPAFENLEQAIIKGFNDYEIIQNESDYSLLRNQKDRWFKLLNKYFPDKVKK
ncbi:MAG: tetratricopeptide repeat protein [Saprospiraceae bacterium]|nr:tetratricopeptide repeat protein [Saprospiraceae bacterium]